MTTVGSLCSGYSGLEMGLKLALGTPLRHAWFCEYDAAPSRILAHHYPDVPNHGDVKTTDWASVEPVDWLTAGYPCQPFSHAGKRKGADDPRHLWPDVARAIGVLRPRGVLLENVRGHVSLGLADVLADLSGLGYDARWGVVRAADAGAPHGRARVFIVAEPAADADVRRLSRDGLRDRTDATDESRSAASSSRRGKRADAPTPDASGERHGRGLHPRAVGRLDRADEGGTRERERAREVAGDRGAAAAGRHPDGRGAVVEWGVYAPAIARWEAILGRPAPRPTGPGRTGERLSPRFVEWLMGLPDGWVTDVPGLSRNHMLKALGNGVVPQQAALACRLLGLGAAERAA